MLPPSRIRRILKWTGLGLSLLILAIWIATLWCGAKTLVADDWLVSTHSGNFFVVSNMAPAKIDTQFFTQERNNFGFSSPAVQLQNSPNPSLRSAVVRIPYWLVLIVTSFPTAWLWHRDRRRIRPGRCRQCDYDLTGNTSGVCSECGLPTPPQPRGPRDDRIQGTDPSP